MVVRIDDGVHGTCDGAERTLTAARPGSVFRTSGGMFDDVSRDPWSDAPLVLCIGEEDEAGSRSLRLRDDVGLGLRLLDGSVLCVHLEADGSDGRIDCRRGGAHDVQVTQHSHAAGAAGPPQVETGLGGDVGPGAATLTTSLGIAVLDSGAPLARCATRSFSVEMPAALTTARATVTVLDAIQGGAVSIEARGESFDCANLTESDTAGTLVLPFPGLDTVVGDTANVLILAD
jgi:hypothetical protein